MSKKLMEAFGVDTNRRRDLRHLFIGICRRNGVEYKSSASKRDWDQVKRTLVWNDDFLRGKLLRPDGKEYWMGEHKVAHPHAYALDTMCQYFLTAKRKLDEDLVQKIMESPHLIDPTAPEVIHGAAQNMNHVDGPLAGQGHSAAGGQGVHQVATQGAQPVHDAAEGPSGGTGSQQTASQIQLAVRTNNNSMVDSVAPAAHGSNGHEFGPFYPPGVETYMQSALLDKLQTGILAPGDCPRELVLRYGLEHEDYFEVLYAKYTEFLVHRKTLCYIRLSTNNAIQYRCCLWVVYLPAIPTRQSILSIVYGHLAARGMMENRIIQSAYLIATGEHEEEVYRPLYDDMLAEDFEYLRSEQARRDDEGLPMGARVLPMIEVELAWAGPILNGFDPALII